MANKSNVSNHPTKLLSVEELLAMPDNNYMNDAQLAFFKNRLRELEQEILANAGATTENLRETQFVPDPADRATIEEEHALELRTRDRERKLLKKVQQSIALIDAGEYGWCEETGEPIGLQRLLARPTATLSLEAQERRETRQKLYGDESAAFIPLCRPPSSVLCATLAPATVAQLFSADLTLEFMASIPIC
jgi:DnaK suppressor protein